MKTSLQRTPISVVLIGASILVTLATRDRTPEVLGLFLINAPNVPFLQSLRSGQWWRLLSPALVHFGVLHIVFNVMWMWDLGRAVELVRGSRFYGLIVLIIAAGSNLAQYLMTMNPLFGGLSGIIYGLLGYCWVMGRRVPTFALQLHRNTVIMMIGWFVLCWTGVLGAIANWAHTAGLVLGLACGFLDALNAQRAGRAARP